MDESENRIDGVYRFSKAERKGIERGLEDMRRGRFASDLTIAAIFAKARLASKSEDPNP
ncbi:MAG TPA: hypothetical protein VEK73_14795 [Xanthobacteraceae bacterium]|nr:hypothetical protein [Xanthobacteraceae bacterium]